MPEITCKTCDASGMVLTRDADGSVVCHGMIFYNNLSHELKVKWDGRTENCLAKSTAGHPTQVGKRHIVYHIGNVVKTGLNPLLGTPRR